MENSELAIRPTERHILNASILEEINGLYNGFGRKGSRVNFSSQNSNFESVRRKITIRDIEKKEIETGRVKNKRRKEKGMGKSKGYEENCDNDDNDVLSHDHDYGCKCDKKENNFCDVCAGVSNAVSEDTSLSSEESEDDMNASSENRALNEEFRDFSDGNVDMVGLCDIGKALNTKVSPVGRKTTVMVIGNISAGKSTLINWILQENVQKTGMAIETCGITYVMQGKQHIDIGGETALLLLPELRDVVERNPSLLTSLSVRTCPLNSIKFNNINFIDTPGLSDGDSIYSFDIDSVLRDMAKSVCDLILVCIDSSGNGLSKRLIELSKYLSENMSAKTKFVLTKIDEVPTEEDRIKVMCQVTQNLTSRIRMKHGFDLIPIFVPGAKDGSYLYNYKRLFGSDTAEQTLTENLNTNNVRAKSNRSNSHFPDRNLACINQNLPTLNRIKDVILQVEKVLDRKVQDEIISLLGDSNMLLKVNKKLIKEQTDMLKNKAKISRLKTVYWSSACFVLVLCIALGSYQLSLHLGTETSLYSTLFEDTKDVSLNSNNGDEMSENLALSRNKYKNLPGNVFGIWWLILLLSLVILTSLYRNAQKVQTKISPKALYTLKKYHKMLKFAQLRASEIHKSYVNS